MRKTGVAVGMLGDGLGQRIVIVLRKRNAVGTSDKVRARAGYGENLYRDPRSVHVGDPRRAKLLERVAPGDLAPDNSAGESRGG